ncbi:sigma-54-dependent Fis family transcriptional regulator, partial [bacterium]|nr:sigma-54-dependent Fis family transcriptional regulator [bacterium]
DLVLLDIKMPGLSGLEVLAESRSLTAPPPVIMVTAIDDARTAVQAMKAGAVDYLNKPFDVDEIRLAVERALKENALTDEVRRLRSEVQNTFKFENIIGSGSAMQRVYTLLRRVVDSESTVLVLGDTGTGKELVARALHYGSIRREGPFIAVHCAAIPSELLESELFGHEKGAFTGALQRRIGMFEAADGGTLFLDEIGEMPLATQSKLLRAVQEREIRRVGSQQTITINVRLVCATNRNLEEEVRQGRFREDLYYRINVVPVTVPPLRERREDIPLLVAHFSQRLAKELGRPTPSFSSTALERLSQYDWPGNVRELEHTLERVIILSDTDNIGPEQLGHVLSRVDTVSGAASTKLADRMPRIDLGDRLEFDEKGLDLPRLTDDIERRAIQEALRRTDGVMTEAARTLHITRRMLRYKMDKLGIPPSHPSGPQEVEDEAEESARAGSDLQ